MSICFGAFIKLGLGGLKCRYCYIFYSCILCQSIKIIKKYGICDKNYTINTQRLFHDHNNTNNMNGTFMIMNNHCELFQFINPD